MKKSTFIICLCFLLFVSVPVMCASALTATIDINNSDIETVIKKENYDPAQVTTLNVSGSMRPRDYQYIMNVLTNLKTLHLSDVTFIPTKAFFDYEKDSGHPSLQLVTAPSVRTIGTYAFYKSPNLYRVQMSDAVDIGYKAFADCPKLSSASFVSCVTIAEGAFQNCTSLKTINIPNVSVIDDNAFRGDSGLKSMSMGGVSRINDNAFFDCDSLVEVEVNASEIGINAFADCDSMTHFSAPLATSIHDGALANCKALTGVNIPSAVNVGSGAFENDSALTAITIGKFAPDFDGAWKTCFKGTPDTLRIYTQGEYNEQQRASLLEFIKNTGGAVLGSDSISQISSGEKIEDVKLEEEPVKVDTPSTDLAEMIDTEKTVTEEWKSTNEDVAVVDSNGIVTAKAEGSTVITAKVIDENDPEVSKEIDLQIDVVENEGSFSVVIQKMAEKIIEDTQKQHDMIEEKIVPPQTADIAAITVFLCVLVFTISYFAIKYADIFEGFFKKVSHIFVPKGN